MSTKTGEQASFSSEGFTFLAHNQSLSTPSPRSFLSDKESYHGIPKALVLALIEVYYDNLYNATLLLHKRLLLESLAADTARPHVVLSVCAAAAK